MVPVGFWLAMVLLMPGLAMGESVILKIPLANNNPNEVSGTVHWIITDGVTGKTNDYFSVCEEHRITPITKIAPGKTAIVSCTSPLLPSIETGPHNATIYFAKMRVDTTYGISKTRIDCSSVGGTLRLSRCNEGEKEVERASAMLGLQKCCLDAGSENADCIGDYCEIECVPTPDGCKKPKLTLVFVPINWKGTEEEYNARVEYYMESVRNEFPLKDCKERIKTVIVPLKNGLEFDFISLGDRFEDRNLRAMQLVENRINMLGYADRYDFGIGIYGDVVAGSCGSAKQGSDIILLFNCPVSTKENRYTLAHELGHKAGLNDEYFDSLRCNFLCINSNSNGLLKELGGDEPFNQNTAGFCAEGSKCLNFDGKRNIVYCEKDSSGNYGSCSPWTGSVVTCKGNKRGEKLTERCIMSYSQDDADTDEWWYQPKTGFCSECMKHLEKVSWLNCKDEQ